MSFRIGSYIFTPSALLLPMALGFFVALSYPRLYPSVFPRRASAWFALGLSAAGGLAGALAYAWVTGSENEGPAHTWLNLRLGSFGGYWGALAGGMAGAAIARRPALACGDALVAGILAGGAVARIGCLFTGCCPGITLRDGWLGGVQPFLPWPGYDIAALLATLGIVAVEDHRGAVEDHRGAVADRRGVAADRREAAGHRQPAWTGSSGMRLGLFLAVYGALRGPLELLRETGAPGHFTPGIAAAAFQLAAGAGLLGWVMTRRRGTAASRRDAPEAPPGRD